MDFKMLSSDGSQPSSLSELLKRSRAELQAVQLDPAAPAAPLDVVELSGKNVMARNFVDDSDQSRYLKSTLSAFAAERQASNRFMGMVESLKTTMAVEIEKAGKYNAGSTIYRVGKRAGAMLEQDRQEEVSREAKVHLDRTRQDIEEAAMPAELLEGPTPAPVQEPQPQAEAAETPLPEVAAGGGDAPEISVDIVV